MCSGICKAKYVCLIILVQTVNISMILLATIVKLKIFSIQNILKATIKVFYYYLLTPRVVYTNKTLQTFYTVSVWSTIVHLRSGSSLNRSPISRNMG